MWALHPPGSRIPATLLPAFAGGVRGQEKTPLSPLQRWKQTAAHWPYVCVCACASVSLLVGQSDVVGREVGNVSFSNKIKYFETRIWQWSFLLFPLFPVYICRHENQARKPHLFGIPGNTSVHTSEILLAKSPNSSVPQFLYLSKQSNSHPVVLEKGGHMSEQR